MIFKIFSSFREATCEHESFSIRGTLATIVFGPSSPDLSVKEGLHAFKVKPYKAIISGPFALHQLQLDIFSDIGDIMSFSLSLAIALSLTLFSNLVIFFYYNEKVQRMKKFKGIDKEKDFFCYCSGFWFEIFSDHVWQRWQFSYCCYSGSIQVPFQEHCFLSCWVMNEFGEKPKIPQSVHLWSLIITETDLFSCGPFLSSSATFWRQKMGFVTGSTLSTRRTHYLSTGTAAIMFVSDFNISEYNFTIPTFILGKPMSDFDFFPDAY